MTADNIEKHFYLFRHGQSTYNELGLSQGQTNDSVLTKKGRQQAFDIGVRLKNIPLQVIFCSPLKRAQETAKEVVKTHVVPILTDNRLTEVNVGEIEGLHYTEIRKKFGAKYDAWRSLDEKYLDLSFKGGETKRQVRTRVFAALNEYARKTDYACIGISGHGILLMQVLLALRCRADDIPNGAVLHLVFCNNIWENKGFLQK